MTKNFDVLVVGDARFSGGSTAALAADVKAMAALGRRIGLIFVRSAYLHDSRDKPNPAALELADIAGVTQISPTGSARAELVFLHHPMVFFCGIEERLRLSAERAVIVAHHPPFRADGSLEWDPLATRLRAWRQTGILAWYAPISGVVRRQLSSFAPLVRQTRDNWPNIFDPADWPVTRPILASSRITIGRHGRADPLKFPDTGEEIDASLPASESIRVRVLGCPATVLAERGAHPDRWDVLEFGSEPVPDFLNSLDFFTYHYHPLWLESFGRTVIEAALCGRPCLLDPRLEPTFGGIGTYCAARETAGALARLAEEPASTRAKAVAAREMAERLYASSAMGARLDALRRDAGDTRKIGKGSATPPVVARKLAGLYRRRATETLRRGT